MSDADKAEMKDLFADAMAEGIARFRSKAEEEAAKNTATDTKPENKGGSSDSGNSEPFSLAGFFLGGN
jgi:hypothetical protein